jgi:hypothetical protein
MFSPSFFVQMFRCGRSSLKLHLKKLDARPNVPVGSFGTFREELWRFVEVWVFGR